MTNSHIVKAMYALWILIRSPKQLYYVINNEDRFRRNVERAYPQFGEGLPQLQLTDFAKGFDESLTTYSFLGGTSQPLDLMLLKILARGFKHCNYLEIGTWRGESLVNLMDTIKKGYSINLPAEELRNRGYSEAEIDCQDFYLTNNEQKTVLIKADSQTFDFASIKDGIDLIFIDGDHHFKAVKADTKNVFRHLVKKDSIVIWHDYTKDAVDIWWEVFYGILAGLPEEFHSRLYHVRNTNCAVYLPQSLKIRQFSNKWKPKLDFSVRISARNHM